MTSQEGRYTPQSSRQNLYFTCVNKQTWLFSCFIWSAALLTRKARMTLENVWLTPTLRLTRHLCFMYTRATSSENFRNSWQQLWRVFATPTHICTAKSSTIILHDLSFRSLCRSHKSQYFSTCQSPLKHSSLVLRDGTIKTTVRDTAETASRKCYIHDCATHAGKNGEMNFKETKKLLWTHECNQHPFKTFSIILQKNWPSVSSFFTTDTSDSCKSVYYVRYVTCCIRMYFNMLSRNQDMPLIGNNHPWWLFLTKKPHAETIHVQYWSKFS